MVHMSYCRQRKNSLHEEHCTENSCLWKGGAKWPHTLYLQKPPKWLSSKPSYMWNFRTGVIDQQCALSIAKTKWLGCLFILFVTPTCMHIAFVKRLNVPGAYMYILFWWNVGILVLCMLSSYIYYSNFTWNATRCYHFSIQVLRG